MNEYHPQNCQEPGNKKDYPYFPVTVVFQPYGMMNFDALSDKARDNSVTFHKAFMTIVDIDGKEAYLPRWESKQHYIRAKDENHARQKMLRRYLEKADRVKEIHFEHAT